VDRQRDTVRQPGLHGLGLGLLEPLGPAGITGGPGNDVLDGGTAQEVLVGDQGTDTLNGNGGDDFLEDGLTTASTDELDADVFNGGPGTDWASYRSGSQAVEVTLNSVPDDGRSGEGDDVRSDVENLLGGSGSDELAGDTDANVLSGNGGDDLLVEAGGPANTDALDVDTFIGGPGVDTVSYSDATASVRVDLDNVADDGRQAPNEGDNVQSDVENVTGGAGNDALFGDADANRLIGNAGADIVSGDAGNDVLRGNAGADALNGGPGAADDCDVGGGVPAGGTEVNCEI
jgi:Ca2+-binding RTX toxin-like protein